MLIKVLFFITLLFNFTLNAVSISWMVDGREVRVDQVSTDHLIALSKVISNDFKKNDIAKITSLRVLKSNEFKKLYTIVLSTKIRGFEKFRATIFYCQELVSLRKQIIEHAKEIIKLLEAGGLSAEGGSGSRFNLKIKIPDDRSANEVVKKASEIYKFSEKYIEDAEKWDVYISMDRLNDMLQKLKRCDISKIIENIRVLLSKYEKLYQKAQNVVTETQSEIERLQKNSEESRELEEQVNALSNNLQKIYALQSLSADDRKRMETLSELIDELKQKTNNVVTQNLREHERALNQASRLVAVDANREEVLKALKTDSQKKFIEYKTIRDCLEKNRNLLESFINEKSTQFKNLSEQLEEIKKSLSAIKQSDLVKENQFGLLKKIRESIVKKIDESEGKIKKYEEDYNGYKVTFDQKIGKIKEIQERINSYTIGKIEENQVFQEEQNTILKGAKKIKEKLDKDIEIFGTLQSSIGEELSPLVKKMSELETSVQSSLKACEIKVLTDEDKKLIQSELERIIEEEAYSSCLPYKFVLNGKEKRSRIPEEWYKAPGKPDPNIAVYLDIQPCKLKDKILRIKFASDHESKEIYLQFLVEELEKLIKKEVLDKDLDFVSRNVIVKYPRKKKGE